jgi:hypothetical protein
VWEETGCRTVIERLAGERKHGFALERAIFLTVLHRRFTGGADRWREDYRIDDVDGLELHHLYRAMAWLGEELPAAEQGRRTRFALRCLKDIVVALRAVGVALPPAVRQRSLISISQITRNVVSSRFCGADFYVCSIV